MTLTTLVITRPGTLVRNTSGNRRRVVSVGPKTVLYENVRTGDRTRILLDSLRRWSQR